MGQASHTEWMLLHPRIKPNRTLHLKSTLSNLDSKQILPSIACLIEWEDHTSLNYDLIRRMMHDARPARMKDKGANAK